MSDQQVLLDKIIERAWKDDAFKARLLKDPRAALQPLIPKLPADLQIEVHEDSATTIHLVIPRDPASMALSDADLDAVAGGGGSDTWCDFTEASGCY